MRRKRHWYETTIPIREKEKIKDKTMEEKCDNLQSIMLMFVVTV